MKIFSATSGQNTENKPSIQRSEVRDQRSEVRGQRSEIGGSDVQSSTVRAGKIFDFKSNAKFNRALKSAERVCTEIKSKNMKKS